MPRSLSENASGLIFLHKVPPEHVRSQGVFRAYKILEPRKHRYIND